MCDKIKGLHNLKVIYRDSNWDCDSVIRWCRDCGAVVIDHDFDGRTDPGAVMKMKFPKETRK